MIRIRLVTSALALLFSSTLALAQPAWKNQTVRVSWTDNTTDETSFMIERSLDGVNFSYLASVGPNVVQYLDRGLSPTRYFYYRVKAVTPTGISRASNVATVLVVK